MKRVIITIRPAALAKLDALRDEKRLDGRGAVVEWLIANHEFQDEFSDEYTPSEVTGL